MKKTIFALYGKAGSGKDTIQKYLTTQHPHLFNPIVSCTTRPPRDYEKDGVDYHFLSVEDFTKQVLNGNMLEATEFRGWFYGTQASALSDNKVNVGVFNIAGIEALLEGTNLIVVPIYVHANDRTRLMRQLLREQNPDCDEICRRFQTDRKDFEDIDFNPYFVWENPEEVDNEDMLTRFEDTFLRLMEKIVGDSESDSGEMGQN